MREVGSREVGRQLLAAQTQAFYPVGRHCVEVSWIRMRFFAAHQIGRRIWKIPVELAKIGKNEVLDLSMPKIVLISATTTATTPISAKAAATFRPSGLSSFRHMRLARP